MQSIEQERFAPPRTSSALCQSLISAARQRISLFCTASQAPQPQSTTFSASLRTQQNLYKPLFTPRFFADMSSDIGVHNLKGKAEFDEKVKGTDKLVILDCYATWCGPCKVIAPKIVEFSHKYPDAKFFKLDVDESPDVAQELGVRAMPTFFIFKNGEKISEVVGANPAAVEKAITANL